MFPRKSNSCSASWECGRNVLRNVMQFDSLIVSMSDKKRETECVYSFRTLYWGHAEPSGHSLTSKGVCWIITPDIHPPHCVALGQWLPRLLTPANLCLYLSLVIQLRLLSHVTYGSPHNKGPSHYRNKDPCPSTAKYNLTAVWSIHHCWYLNHFYLCIAETMMSDLGHGRRIQCIHVPKPPKGLREQVSQKATSGQAVDVCLSLEATLQISLRPCSNLWG